MDALERDALIAALRALPGELAALVGQLDTTSLTTAWLPGEWTVAQNVHHLLDSHLHCYLRSRRILAQDRPMLQAYDQDAWALLPDAGSAAIGDSLHDLEWLHRRWAALFEGLSAADLARGGTHEETGEVRLAGILRSYVAHGQAHLDQIRRTLAARPATAPAPLPARFPALLLEADPRQSPLAPRSLEPVDLPDQGPVWVAVDCSSLNYKDALALTGRGRILKGYPMVPGIDLAGTVLDGGGSDLRPGDAVLVTGRGIGEEHWGGYAGLARVQAEWCLPLPAGLDARRAMLVGTAGYTAMLAAMTLEDHGLTPGDGEVLVTGAAGGVGSFAVAILSALGHRVIVSTGRLEEGDYLRALGAAEVIHRAELSTPPTRPLGPARWAGAVDSVGGHTLATVISQTRRHGTVASCGLAGGSDLATTVFPFILRGVNLCGVDSNYCLRARRAEAWRRLAALPESLLARIDAGTVGLEGLPAAAERMLAGGVRGRLVVRVGG